VRLGGVLRVFPLLSGAWRGSPANRQAIPRAGDSSRPLRGALAGIAEDPRWFETPAPSNMLVQREALH
jgi:hypothetical protein